jgi:hypothetical protein
MQLLRRSNGATLEAHEEYLKKISSPTWYGEQDENGVDLSLIRANLKLTPLERLRQGDRYRRQALRFMNARRISNTD